MLLYSACEDLKPIISIIKNGLIPIVQIGIPILLIVFGTIDLGKAVIASDDKKIKDAQSMLIKRLIYAVAIFFVVTIVTVVINLVAQSKSSDISKGATTNWRDCWDSV